MKEIQEKLFLLQDDKFKKFQSTLIPTVEGKKVIGIKTPALRNLAKEIYGTELAENFLAEVPHEYFEENQLHNFLIENIKDFDLCLKKIEEFLPYIDNWATCDQLCPKVLKKNHEALEKKIYEWIKSDRTYTVRFAIRMLMNFFLDDEHFDEKYLETVAGIRSEEYYLNMMISWYFATALAKKWEPTFAFLKKNVLSDWCIKKTVQKARESFRISDQQKELLSQTFRK